MNAKDRLQRYLQQITSLCALAGDTLTTSDYRLAFSALRSIPVDNELLQIADEFERASLETIKRFMETGNLPDAALDRLEAVAKYEGLRIELNDLVLSWQGIGSKYPMMTEIRQAYFKCASEVLNLLK